MDFLQAYLARADAWNCSTLPADWLIECGYPDFAAEYRDLTDPEACDAVARAQGGLDELWEALFKGAVPWSTEPHHSGDIAVVSILGHDAGAIFTGERWALRQDHGLVFAAPEHLTVIRGWRP